MGRAVAGSLGESPHLSGLEPALVRPPLAAMQCMQRERALSSCGEVIVPLRAFPSTLHLPRYRKCHHIHSYELTVFLPER